MFSQFTHLVSNASGWAYGVVFMLALLDAILLALGIGLAVGGLVEAVRWALRRRRGQSAPP